jgi:uncharacterized protein YgiM (DUF1202 family)
MFSHGETVVNFQISSSQKKNSHEATKRSKKKFIIISSKNFTPTKPKSKIGGKERVILPLILPKHQNSPLMCLKLYM